MSEKNSLLNITSEIEDSELRILTISLLSKYKKILSILPASISGKYHLGETAQDHIMRVAWFVKRIIEEFNLSQEEKDILISSALLHDIGYCVVTTRKRVRESQIKYKTGWYRSMSGSKYHPIISMFLIGVEAFNQKIESNPLVVKVVSVVSSHMSHWTLECPQPMDDLAKYLALADYLASRKEIKIEESSREGNKNRGEL